MIYLKELLELSTKGFINKVNELGLNGLEIINNALKELEDNKEYSETEKLHAKTHLKLMKIELNINNGSGSTTKAVNTDYDNRSEVEEERDEDGNIKYYHYKIYIKDQDPLIGVLNREEMAYIHKMYTFYGAGLTQRQVSRMFPELSLVNFRRILNAFSITKASAPFPKHMIEELSNKELEEIQLRQKEDALLNSLDKNEISDLKKTASNLASKLRDAQDVSKAVADVVSNLDLHKIVDELQLYDESKLSDDDSTLIVWLSDMHVGASVGETSIYSNNYDMDEIEYRLDHVLDCVKDEIYNNKLINKVIVVNLGDSLDGMDGYTVSRTHRLDQNMDNKEQLNNFLTLMTKFMLNLRTIISDVSYKSVGESNHDGDFGYAANVALVAVLKSLNIDAEVSDGFYLNFYTNERLYICCHGKDTNDMNRGFPLLLNTTVENKINEYLDSKKLFPNVYPKITFAKGDQHQHAITYGRRFKYHSMPSLFGSSSWIHKNFGNTPWGAILTTVDSEGIEADKIINYINK